MRNTKTYNVVYKETMFLWTSFHILVLICVGMPRLQYKINISELFHDAVSWTPAAVWLWRGRAVKTNAFQILCCQADYIGRLVYICSEPSYSLCYSYDFRVVIIHMLSTVLWIFHLRGIVANFKKISSLYCRMGIHCSVPCFVAEKREHPEITGSA